MAASLLPKKGGTEALDAPEAGRMPSCMPICSADGKPLMLLLTEGPFSDCKAAFVLLAHLPPGAPLIADKACGGHCLRHALRARKIRPCIPLRGGQWDDGRFDPCLYRQCVVIERFLARLKDFRRNAMRHDRCPIRVFTAITVAAIAIAFL